MELSDVAALLAVLALVLVVAAAARRHRRPPRRSLYDRLGGAFPVAAVVNRFSDEVLRSPVVGVGSPNPQLREWSRAQSAARLPGLKFLRTLWVADVAGGAQRYAGTKQGARGRLDLGRAHRHLRISGPEFDEVARILAKTLDEFNVPAQEKSEVLAAFAAHKKEVVGHPSTSAGFENCSEGNSLSSALCPFA